MPVLVSEWYRLSSIILKVETVGVATVEKEIENTSDANLVQGAKD